MRKPARFAHSGYKARLDEEKEEKKKELEETKTKKEEDERLKKEKKKLLKSRDFNSLSTATSKNLINRVKSCHFCDG